MCFTIMPSFQAWNIRLGRPRPSRVDSQFVFLPHLGAAGFDIGRRVTPSPSTSAAVDVDQFDNEVLQRVESNGL